MSLGWRIPRDTVLLVGGMAGMAWQSYAAFVGGQEVHPELVMGFLTMMGLTAFLRSDEKKKEEKAS